MTKEYYQGEVFDALDPGTLLRGAEYNDCTFKNCRRNGVRIENCSLLSRTFERCTEQQLWQVLEGENFSEDMKTAARNLLERNFFGWE